MKPKSPHSQFIKTAEILIKKLKTTRINLTEHHRLVEKLKKIAEDYRRSRK